MQDGPLIMHIADVKEGSYDKPDLVFESGEILSLNVTNIIALVKAYGDDGLDWIGKKIEIYLGQTEYKKELVDTVLVRPLTPGMSDEAKTDAAVRAAAADSMKDDIPF